MEEKKAGRLEDRLVFAALYDVYGALLTAHQRECLDFYLNDDLSLAEIADALGNSRQAVYDMLRRSRQILDGYEEKLNIIARQRSEREQLEEIAAALESAQNAKQLTAAKTKLRDFIHSLT